MEERKIGGRPPNTKIKVILRRIMQEIEVADVNLAKVRFTEATGQSANYHTIKKYLDQLVDVDFLRVQVVNNNIKKIEKGHSQVRRRVFLYQVNQFSHPTDKKVISPV